MPCKIINLFHWKYLKDNNMLNYEIISDMMSELSPMQEEYLYNMLDVYDDVCQERKGMDLVTPLEDISMADYFVIGMDSILYGQFFSNESNIYAKEYHKDVDLFSLTFLRTNEDTITFWFKGENYYAALDDTFITVSNEEDGVEASLPF